MTENVEIRRLKNLENRSYLEIIHGFIRNAVEMEYCLFETEKFDLLMVWIFRGSKIKKGTILN